MALPIVNSFSFILFFTIGLTLRITSIDLADKGICAFAKTSEVRKITKTNINLFIFTEFTLI